MKMLLPGLAKRLLSFALALVLLLSLCPALPLTANAYEYTDGWVKLASGFKGKIVTSDEDMTYEDDEPYDWEVYLYQNQTSLTVDARATIYDENGNTVGGSPVTIHPYATKDRYSLMFSASDYTALTTDLEGTFTLKLEIGSKGTLYAQLEKTFTRVINDTPQGGNTSSNGWAPISKYSWVNGAFNTQDMDLIYEENQAYDWNVTIQQSRTSAAVSFNAVIKDEAGNTISTYSGTETVSASSTGKTMFGYSNFPALTMDLGGMFTLTADFYLPGQNNEYFGTLTQTFTRIAKDTNAAFEDTSRSRPRKVFTFADPIDLELNIEKTNGVEEAFNAVTTITNANGETVAGPNNYSIPSSTNTTVSVKDLVDVTNIETAGNYKVNVTLNDTKGSKRYETAFSFAVVAMDRTVSVSFTGASTFADSVPVLTVNLIKDDGVTENCSVYVTVTDTDTGNNVYSYQVDGDISGTDRTKIQLTLSSLPIVGNFRMDVEVKDSEGNQLGSNSTSFERISSTPLTADLTDRISSNPKAGMIYTNTDNPLVLEINHPSSANKTLTIHCTGVYNGKTLDETRDITMPSNGTITLNAKDFLKYGIYENLRLSIYNSAGDELWIASKLYTFSFVIDNTNSASLPLLNMNVHYTNMGEDPMIEQVNFSAMAGTSAWRSSITWDAVEKVSGDYGVPEQLEAVMDQTKAKGMKALIILAYNNNNPKRDSNGSIIYDSNNKTLPMYGDPDPTNSEWLNAYTEYCKFVADYMNTYYPGMVVGYEIWNEWNNASMSKVNNEDLRKGNVYAQLVIAASEAIKEVDPNANIIGGATAGDADSNTLTFMKAMLGTPGLINAIDGFSFHSYADKETTTEADRLQGIRRFERVSPAGYSFASRITNVKKLLAQYGAPDDLEIWLTETSWSTNAEPEEGTSPHDNKYHIYYGVTEEQQASYMVQLYTLALADGTLDRIFWYDLLNDRNKVNSVWTWQTDKGECNWGLLHTWDENATGEHIAYEAKQGYVAMCALNSKLAGTTNGRSITLGSGIHAYQFEKDGHYLMVAWTTDGTTKNLTANLNGQMVITDMFGNETEYAGSAPLTLSESPIYIEYAMGSHPSIG